MKDSKNLNHFNLNFCIDNLQIMVHNFLVEMFDNVTGYDTHQHSSYELHYIKEGNGNVIFNDTIYELKVGDLYILAPFTPHRQTVHSKGMIEYALRFDIHKLCTHTNNLTTEAESSQIIELIKMSINKIIHNQQGIEIYFEKGFEEAYLKMPGYYLTLKHAIMEIIIATARLSLKTCQDQATYELPSRSIEVRQIELLTEFIQDNISSQLANNLLAQYVHISERQLHRLIKKHIGLSPHQFVMEQRINHVKYLLDKRIYSLKSISEMAGFSSEFHLSTAFKKYEKITPTEYSQKTSDIYIDTKIRVLN